MRITANRLAILAALCFISFGRTGTVWAASFDCAKARTKVEHMICDNPDISKLDEELKAAYKTALQDQTQSDSIRHLQKVWMKVRNACMDVACIRNAYSGRLTLLRATPNLEYDGKHIAADYVSDDSAMDRDVFEHENANEVCDLYLQNLQYFARRNLPMSCGQPIAPSLEGNLERIEWEDIDPEKFSVLFRETVEKLQPPHQGDVLTENELVNIRNKIQKKEYAFRRAKLTLIGHPTSTNRTLSQWAKGYANRYHEDTAPELKLTIIQFGPDINSSSNPEKSLRCNTKQIRGGAYFFMEVPVFLLATEDLHHLYGELQLISSAFPQYLWRIKGHLYGEGFSGGEIQLSELGGVVEGKQDTFFFESVCLYKYEAKSNTKGNE